MKLTTIKSEGLAHRSYLLSDGEEAVLIDPRRDSQTYLRQAEKACTDIKYILETHRNEDYGHRLPRTPKYDRCRNRSQQSLTF